MAKKPQKEIPHGTEYSDKAVEEIKKISPLALPEYIAQCEFYDEKESRKVFDEVVAEFEKDGGSVDSILKPVMYTVADGLLEAIPGGAAMRRKGLTPQRIITECEAFSYSDTDVGAKPIPGIAYVDFKNARDQRTKFGESLARRYDANMRKQIYADTSAMNKYKEKTAGGSAVMRDEYTGQRIYRTRDDATRNGASGQVANTDHIVSLSEIQHEFAGNFALSRKDIREIANQDYNFAMTSAAVNIPKSDRSMKGYLAYLEKHPDKVPAGFNVEKARDRMLKMEKEAKSAVYTAANKKVLKNLEGALKGDRKGKVIRGRLAGKATDQAKDYAIGNVVLYLLKPLYWELKDSFRNGFKGGVNADSGVAAIKYRFGRVKNYLVKHAKEFLGDSIWEFIKGFVSALIEGIIGLFVGIFRSVFKLIKEGIRIFVQAAKILWGKGSANRSPAEKGDAIVKLIGASVASLAGIGIDAMLSSIGAPKPLRVPLATMLSGIASALFMYLLDKADLFSVKAERRYQRIKEVFDARVADMKEDAAKFDSAITERLRNDMLEFAYLKQSVNKAAENHDVKLLDGVLTQMASFFAVKLPYSDAQSFVRFVKGNKDIRIDAKTVAA